MQTAVGVIPDNWEVSRLDALGAGLVPPIKAGPFGSSLTKDNYVSTGFKVYGQEQVIRGDFLYGDYFISARKYRELESCAVRPGDVLLSLVGTAGRLLEIPDGAPAGIINPRLIRFSFDKGRVLPRFFRYLFQADSIQSLLQRHSQGGTMGILNSGVLRSFCIPLPPLREQRAIAEAFSDVDALLAGMDKALTKKRRIRQAVLQEILTGKTRLPGFSGEWKSARLGALGEISGGGVDKKRRSDEPTVRLLNYMDVYRRSFVYSQHIHHVVTAPPQQIARCAISKGDVFFTPSSEMPFDVARSAVAMEGILDAAYSYHVVRLRLHEDWDLLFRGYAFKSQEFLTQAAQVCEGSGVRYVITQAKFRQMSVRFPPTREEQAAIAEVLSDLDTEINALEARRDKTRALKHAMMQELLTGRTRLV